MTTDNISRYILPRQWAHYDTTAIFNQLVEAKTAAGILRQMPHLPQWIEPAHEEQLRLEAVGTSRIEGAEFTEREQEQALRHDAPAIGGLTHSQLQLRCADATYRWLRAQPLDRPVTAEFISDIHRRIVTGCDDDHCTPGALRSNDANVTFGMPRCRGVAGGDDCADAFGALTAAVGSEFRRHDGIIQALALHYHIGAMHPFGDGNGRTARATEAFVLRHTGVSDLVMVSLSNYYYAHQDEYLTALFECRQRAHDLTPFLQFALPAVTERCSAVATEIVVNNKRVLFREFARSLFGQLRNSRRRVLAQRQLQILDTLMDTGRTQFTNFIEHPPAYYQHLKYPYRALIRDIVGLLHLKALCLDDSGISVNLDWPQQFSESELLRLYENLPAAASANHPALADLSQLLNRRR